MSNYDYTNLTTRELLEKAMNGEIPIPRNNPKFGESKYFFMKMGSDPYSSINDAETFDVPDDVDPFEFRDNGYSVPLTSSLDTPLTDSGDSWLDSSDSNLQNGLFSPTPENWNDTIIPPTIPANGKALSSYYGNSIANNKPSLLETAFSRLNNPFVDMNGFGKSIKENYRPYSLQNVTNRMDIEPHLWETSAEGKEIYNSVVLNEGMVVPLNQTVFEHAYALKKAYDYLKKNKDILAKRNDLTDKFKHAFLNCEASQYGQGGYDMSSLLSYAKEASDLWDKRNTLDASIADNYANKIGRLLGTKYPTEDCETLISPYIKKYIK